MNQAYDLAYQTLQNIGQLEVHREIIARGILQAAESGERDANDFRDGYSRTNGLVCQRCTWLRGEDSKRHIFE